MKLQERLFIDKKYYEGLRLTNNGGDATNDLDIAAGVASDTTGLYSMVLPSSITKRLDAVFAVGTNQGGLDTGSKAANTTYHVFLIRNLTTGVVDVLYSTSPTNPTMPSGFTLKRRIGSLKTTAGSAWPTFLQEGRMFYHSQPQMGYNVDGGSVSANQTITLGFFPTGLKFKCHGHLWSCGTSNQSTGYAWVSAGGTTGPLSDTTVNDGISQRTDIMSKGGHTAGEASALWHQSGTFFEMLTNTSAQLILSTGITLGGATTIRLRVIAWEDISLY